MHVKYGTKDLYFTGTLGEQLFDFCETKMDICLSR